MATAAVTAVTPCELGGTFKRGFGWNAKRAVAEMSANKLRKWQLFVSVVIIR